ncbi:signal peptidase subunit, putative [Eimeria necatrix]|uniref:Signal peptidase complex subunit 3 n=2 Tax=Eimeria TaxID=5800 RepID=U6MHZ4_9EIME|nr:signal peptidase subunit, putative [Eimeria tenella]XP_013440993.1 signal peptidase subunit, putative [Eimeria necatrix]CDJ41530.1 signal peptidase subunit, putative [Eimeria tenella]CDJ63631.1 signal peptidase subunit, putative [Eimeria necatrix]|eukprot:XP_013232280.1 signal peptidase subunit, putative [Eimeria tenella]
MESYLNRANAVFCALMVSLSVLAIGNVISSYFLMGPISGSIAVKDVYGFSYNYALNGDQAVLSLDIKADLRGLFQWNAKQVYLFVVAEYETPQHPTNQVVVFDRIIMDDGVAVIDWPNTPAKYHFRDKGRGLRGREVTVKLQVVYHPIVGRMYTQTIATNTFRMPGQYDRVTHKQQQEQQQQQAREAAMAAAARPEDIA